MCYYATHLSPSNIWATVSNFCMRGGRSATRIDWESALSPREAGLDRLNSFIRSLRVKNIQHNSDLRSLFLDLFKLWGLKVDIFGSRCSSKKAAGLEMTNEELASFGSQSRVATYEILFRKSEKYVYDEKGFGNDKWKAYKLWQCWGWQVYPFSLYLSVNSLIKMQEKSKLIRFCDDLSIFF